MSFNPIAGKFAQVKVTGTQYAFDKWSLEMKVGMVKVTNFTGSGFAQYIPGIYDGKATVSGPYDEGNMPFVVGNLYPLDLVWNSGISLSVLAWLETIKSTQEVEDAGRVELTFQPTGPFTVNIS